jgi:formate dehydrogenase gamma subunit
MTKKEQKRSYERFPVSYRAEHILLILTFTTLAVTGLVQKFPTGWFSEWFVGTLGGVENVRVVHRVAAAMLVLEAVYHLAVVGYRVFVLRTKLSMLPGIDDVRAALEALMYNVGLRKTRPLEGRYNFVEKAEYWALVWGTIVMAITGFMLWNPIATARILPGEFIPAAKAAHGAEAILAAAAIVVWHFYHAHVKFFNKSMFTGKLTEEQMAHEHPLELAEIKAGMAQRPVAEEHVARRRRVYLPASVVGSVLVVAGLVYFMTFEETAIATVPPPEDVQVYVPLTPTPFPTPLPTATPLPVAELTWAAGLGDLFQERCGTCHTTDSATGGLDVTSYGTLLSGGDSGPSIVPGDPSAGTVMEQQSTGEHSGQFSADELALIREWISAGAPEQ